MNSVFVYGMLLHPHTHGAGVEVVGPAVLRGWALRFRGVAIVEQAEGEEVQGLLLLRCTDAALLRLDGIENVDPWRPRSSASGMYRRVEVEVLLDSPHPVRADVYAPNFRGRYSPPGGGYLQTILDGYETFGLDRFCLDEALQHAEREGL